MLQLAQQLECSLLLQRKQAAPATWEGRSKGLLPTVFLGAALTHTNPHSDTCVFAQLKKKNEASYSVHAFNSST